MGHEKVLNLLNEASDSKFMTRRWNMVNDQSKKTYDVGNVVVSKYQSLIFLIKMMLTF